MDIELEKLQIIEGINQIHDEWLLKAIKRLLGLDYYGEDIPEEHKQILDSRINAYEAGKAKTIEWEEAKKDYQATNSVHVQDNIFRRGH